VKRREFVAGLFGTAAWPLGARAQRPSIPVIGFIRSRTEDGFAHLLTAFRQGLRDSGYVEGQNLVIEYRWANNQAEKLPSLAADLVSRGVVVIVANHGSMAAVMVASKTIPIVFSSGDDPVAGGLVDNLSRPGGNVTGVSFFDIALSGKRLGILDELSPKTTGVALLVDGNFASVEAELRELTAAAKAAARPLVVMRAATEKEIDLAFSTIENFGVGALVVGAGPFYIRERQRIIDLAARFAIPAIYVQREFVLDGGLISYGASQTDAYRRAGAFVARVLNGEKPGDMPVELVSKVELIINQQTAVALNLTIPPSLLARADEVIE